MISLTEPDGSARPLRFQVEGRDGITVIKIDSIISKQEEKLAGNRMLVFSCQSVIGDIQRRFELKYEITTCKWYLYKI
jgi:hypothetical protein